MSEEWINAIVAIGAMLLGLGLVTLVYRINVKNDRERLERQRRLADEWAIRLSRSDFANASSRSVRVGPTLEEERDHLLIGTLESGTILVCGCGGEFRSTEKWIRHVYLGQRED